MEKDICIICNTFSQILMAIQLKSTLFKADRMYVIITDKSPVRRDIIERIKALKYFASVVYIQSSEYCQKRYSFREKINDIIDIINGRSIELGTHKVDLLMYYNLDLTTLALYAELYNNNHTIKCARYEEGILSYNNPLDECFKFKIGNFIRRVLGKRSILQNTKTFYCCYPDVYEGNLKVVRIPRIKASAAMGTMMKWIFNLKSEDLAYKEKYIYFSSVYDFEGGDPIGEIELVKAIRDHVGNDNLLVKVHPRDTRTVYADENFHVDRNSKLPWEAIQLNINCSDKVFITANSGSVLSINMLIDPMPKTVFAYDCCHYQGNLYAVNTITNLKKLLNDDAYKKYLSNVYTINRVEEL